MRNVMMVGAALVLSFQPLVGQRSGSDPIEVPLRMEQGRLIVSVDAPNGESYDFGLVLGMSFLEEGFAKAMGEAVGGLTLAGAPVDMEHAQSVPASYVGEELGLSGLVGGATLNRFDVLIDVPNGRLVLKPLARSVRWPDENLTSPSSVRILHEVFLATEVQIGGEVFRAVMDFAAAGMQVNEAVRTKSGYEGNTVDSFRLGYSGWSDLPIAVTDSPMFGGWDPNGDGFVIIGAELARDCVIAISWAHSEIRTCRR